MPCYLNENSGYVYDPETGAAIPLKWETYCDESYYGMWAVRPAGDKSFESLKLFHLVKQEEAERLRDYLNSLESKK